MYDAGSGKFLTGFMDYFMQAGMIRNMSVGDEPLFE